MKKKYIISLCLIGLLLFLGVGISVGYGLWVATKHEEKESTTLNCFKIYYSNSEGTIERHNVKPVVNEEGKESSPITLTVTNICKEPKELQLRLNITKDNTIDIDGLTILATGNIEQDIILYKDLTSTKSTDKDVVDSKLIGLVKVEPGETVRTNIKFWFNERKAPNLDSTKFFSARFELIDTESSIKPTFSETILAENKVDPEFQPDLKKIATDDQGLIMSADEKGNVYYFRGNPNNNYFYFAGNMWRITRINSDRTIRVVLDHNIDYGNYSRFTNAIDYTGLKYVYNNQTINNDVMNYLESWYYNNISIYELDPYVAIDTFCNDTSSSYANYHTYFGGVSRVNDVNPSFICPVTNNDFGSTYNQKIGLLSADEVIFAGGLKDIANPSYFLYTGESFYTMTPVEYYNYHAYVYFVNENGALLTTETNSVRGIRPVINIDSTVSVTGKGTKDNPYQIDFS